MASHNLQAHAPGCNGFHHPDGKLEDGKDACRAAPVHDAHHEYPVKACYSPKELYDHIVEAGVAKAAWPLHKMVTMGLIAAFYIGFSGVGMMIVGGQIPSIQANNPGLYSLILGGFGFPLGLFMICTVGADLFTSNCAYMMVALHEGRIRFHHLLLSWVGSWWINLAGSMIMALIVHWAMIFHDKEAYTLWLAHKKTSYPFGATLCKGILANWLVNIAVWIANASQDVTGKAVGIWLPISAFIAMGGEHCIANQFLFTLAKLMGSDITVRTIIVKNLIPSTIGNVIGGAFFVGTMYSFALGSLVETTCHAALDAFWFLRGLIMGTRRPPEAPRDVESGLSPRTAGPAPAKAAAPKPPAAAAAHGGSSSVLMTGGSAIRAGSLPHVLSLDDDDSPRHHIDTGSSNVPTSADGTARPGSQTLSGRSSALYSAAELHQSGHQHGRRPRA